MNLTHVPKVSLGVPVYNGENYLAEALESLRLQTYEDFEVIISDNGSTDTTGHIAQQFAELDPRFKYHFCPVNQGAAWNFQRVLELSLGEYFKWAAHDDVIEPDYLRVCVEALDDCRPAVLCQTRVRLINEFGEECGVHESRLAFDSPDPVVRFGDSMFGAGYCFEVFGLMRAEVLRLAGPMGDYGHADGVLLSRLALLGPFVEPVGYLQRMRLHASQSSSAYGRDEGGSIDYRSWADWYRPRKHARFHFPYWRRTAEYGSAAVVTPGLTLGGRMRSLCLVMTYARKEWRRYVRELLYVAGIEV